MNVHRIAPFLRRGFLTCFEQVVVRAKFAPFIYSGIDIQRCAHIEVSSCQVRGTHNPLRLEAVTDSILHHCEIRENNKGILLRAGSSRNAIHDNLLEDHPGDGIILLEESNENEIYQNICTRNQTGIYVDSSDSNLLRNNTTNVNGWFGIWVRQGKGNIVRANEANENGTKNFVQAGIVLGLPSPFGGPLYAIDTLVEDNTALRNHGEGTFKIDLFDNGLFDDSICNNTWKNNVFSVDNEPGSESGPGAGCIR